MSTSPKSMVVRILAAVVLGLVVFAFLSLQCYLHPPPFDNMMISSKDANIKQQQQQPPSLVLAKNQRIIHDSLLASEKKKRILQKRVRQWLLLFDLQQQQQQQPPNTPGAFIHVSKTGGSTLSSQLRNACHSWMPKPCNHNSNNNNNNNSITNESFISRLTTYYHVPDFHLLAQRIQTANQTKDDDDDYYAHGYEFYVWTMRDPLERTISAFVYQHPENIKVRKGKFWQRLWQRGIPAFLCFPTLESFATALGDNYNPLDDYDYPFNVTTVNNTNCTRLARAIMDNKVAIPAHLHYSFNWLRQQHILPAPPSSLDDSSNNNNDAIHLAIRTEHLWDDWTTANQWLGQENVTTFSNIRLRQQSNNDDDNDSQIDYPVKREISYKGQVRLCRALKNEYQAYLQLLQLAVNLNDQERQDSLVQARQNCPSLNLQFQTA